jgi:hypothetical protein
MRIVTYLIEYLGEFEFIFETIFDDESGDQIVLLIQTNRHGKSNAWVPLMFCHTQPGCGSSWARLILSVPLSFSSYRIV